MALVPLNTFKTKTAVLTTLNYNKAKCSRDTGLIIDSIAFDILFGGDSQTRFAATQYWSQGETEIPGEVLQTLSALEHAKQVALKIIVKETVLPSRGNVYSQDVTGTASTAEVQQLVEDEFNLIIDVIRNGTAGITNKIVGNLYPSSASTAINNAITLLTNNRTFLQHEVVAYVNTTFGPGYKYNRTKCARDTGLIVDSLAFDLRFDGNTQSMFSGIQYWATTDRDIPSVDLSPTLAAMTHLKAIAKQVVLNQTVIVSPTNESSQVIDPTVLGSLSSQTKVENLFTNVYNIINNGPKTATIDREGVSTVGVTNGIYPNGDLVSDSGFLNASIALQVNKQFLEDEMMAWITAQVANATVGTTWYEFAYGTTTAADAAVKAAKCKRDVGYVIDCISFDLRYGGNRQSLQAGSYYWNYSSTTGALTPTTSITADLMEIGVAYTIIDSTGIDFTTYGATSNAVGTTFVLTQTPPISNLYGIVVRASEISETVAGYEYLKSIIGSIIEGQPLTEIYQSDVKQVITLDYGTTTQTAAVNANIDLITGIIVNGPDTSVKYPISLEESPDINNINASALLLANKAFIEAEVIAYIDTSTQYITVNAVDMIDGQYYTILSAGSTTFTNYGAPSNSEGTTFKATGPGTGNGTVIAGFSYPNSTTYSDTNLCFRDVGFIVDCINFDLKYTGNRQAVQAGVYYFKNSATTSVVASEKTDTVNAYQYLRIAMDRVLNHSILTNNWVRNLVNGSTYVTAPYQTEVVQTINLPKPEVNGATTYTVVSERMADLVDGMTTIISDGPPDTTTVLRTPISAGTPTADNVKGYNLIRANRDFLIAEVIGYMDILTSPNTTKIYTTPPGITAIVLMAQVANVTDHNIKITFCHYRNLPAAIDPATLNGYQAPNTVTEIVKEYLIPPNDAASLIQGKLIIESFDSIVAYATESHGLKVTLSILETANA